MAEEDIIFGKNRHFFGGIEPSNVKSFKVTRDIPTNKLKIKITLPNDTTVENQSLCTVGGAVIRRKTTGYPKDEFDGDLVADVTASGTYTDTGADTDVSYYYAAFPYSTQGVYNRGYANRAKYTATGKLGYYYGFDLDTLDSNPNTRVSYPADVQNANYTPIKLIYSGDGYYFGRFDYGDWPSKPGEKFMPTPCILTSSDNWKTSSVLYDLDPNDYTKTADGNSYTLTQPFRYMMRWPKIYIHREVVSGVYKFRCSNVKVDESWDCLCNYDRYNNEIDNFFMGIYSNYSNYDVGTTTKTSGYRGSFSTLLQSTNADWNIELLVDHLLIQDLLIMISKTTNLISAFGRGYYYDTNDGTYNRALDKCGLFYGEQYAREPVKIFGMENYWGNYYRVINGFIIKNGDIKIKLTCGTHDGTTVTGYNDTGNGYLTVGSIKNYTSTTGTYGGYISGMLMGFYGRIPIIPKGSSTTYETDKFEYKYDNENTYFAIVGKTTDDNDGTSVSLVDTGPFSIIANNTINNASSLYNATWYSSYKPTKGTFK